MLELAYKRTGESDVEVFEILYGAWNWKPIFTQKWAWTGGGGVSPRQLLVIGQLE